MTEESWNIDDPETNSLGPFPPQYLTRHPEYYQVTLLGYINRALASTNPKVKNIIRQHLKPMAEQRDGVRIYGKPEECGAKDTLELFLTAAGGCTGLQIHLGAGL